MRRLVLLAPALLLLAGCSSPGTAGPADSKATSEPNSSSSSSASASSGDASQSTGEAKFGQTVTFPDGMKVTVTDKGTFKPSDSAAVIKKAKKYEQYQVTLTNGSKKKFDPALVSVSLQDGEDTSEQVVDVEKSIGIGPTTKLLPGRTVKWKVAFGTNTKDLVMEVTAGFDNDPAIFTSK